MSLMCGAHYVTCAVQIVLHALHVRTLCYTCSLCGAHCVTCAVCVGHTCAHCVTCAVHIVLHVRFVWVTRVTCAVCEGHMCAHCYMCAHCVTCAVCEGHMRYMCAHCVTCAVHIVLHVLHMRIVRVTCVKCAHIVLYHNERFGMLKFPVISHIRLSLISKRSPGLTD